MTLNDLEQIFSDIAQYSATRTEPIHAIVGQRLAWQISGRKYNWLTQRKNGRVRLVKARYISGLPPHIQIAVRR